MEFGAEVVVYTDKMTLRLGFEKWNLKNGYFWNFSYIDNQTTEKKT